MGIFVPIAKLNIATSCGSVSNLHNNGTIRTTIRRCCSHRICADNIRTIRMTSRRSQGDSVSSVLGSVGRSDHDANFKPEPGKHEHHR